MIGFPLYVNFDFQAKVLVIGGTGMAFDLLLWYSTMNALWATMQLGQHSEDHVSRSLERL